MDRLNTLTLRGYKSIRDQTIDFGPVNVLIGANGAGKSNLLSFFKLLNEMMGHRLQKHVTGCGGGAALLHYGPKQTPQMEAILQFETEKAKDSYFIRLFHGAVDRLGFAEERLEVHTQGYPEPKVVQLGSGHSEAKIKNAAEAGDQTAIVFRHLLNNCRVYHFHDTSASAHVRQYGYIEADQPLLPDAGNLAAVLHRLKNTRATAYSRIVATVRQVAPFFEDFDLKPSSHNDKNILLNWKDRHSDQIFGPHQISDGTLRAMALITLLLQPEEELPMLIVIDEPELGFHPFAINVLAALVKQAATRCQIVLATQSASLLDHFAPEEVVVVERQEVESIFQRLEPSRLKEWLADYSLRELWEKNVIGGSPA
jgi:predicted ATPase